MTDTGPISDQLARVYDQLIELVGQAKQASWTAPSSEQREALYRFMLFLGEQAAGVDEVERRIGTRPSWVTSPTVHRPRNIAGEAAGDPARILQLLKESVTDVIAGVRRLSSSLDGRPRQFLEDLAVKLEERVAVL